MAKNNQPMVLSGPSGGGKSTLLQKLLAEFPNAFGFSISHTTRSPRAGEVNGKEYHFVTSEVFQEEIEKNRFIEHAVFSGNRYGTTVKAVEDVSITSRICILDLDRQGVQSLKKLHLNAHFVFIQPPSLEVLEQRLRGRKTETEESLKKRLGTVAEDLEFSKQPGSYDLVVVNDDLDSAYALLRNFVVRNYPVL